MRCVLSAIFLLAVAAAAGADTIVMRDGTTRQGTILGQDLTDLRLRLNAEGISSTIAIPLPQIARIIRNTPATHPTPATLPAASVATSQPTLAATQLAAAPPGTLPAASELVPTASDAELAAYHSRGFVFELLAATVDKGLADLNRLPAAQRELWNRAVKADADGHKAETLDSLRDLEAAMQQLPEGIARLNAISRKLRNESFGVWMGKLHWEFIADKYSTGQFDLKDIRDVERPTLIGMLKQNTHPALDPLKPHFPPVDPKTSQLGAFRNSQLQGITVANALEVKDQALRAAAILAAQLKLEPAMPAVDRNLLSTQLACVNRILSRARDLEPSARTAIARAEQEKRIAEEKARREAAIAAQRKPKQNP